MQSFFVSFPLLEILETFSAVSAVIVQFVGVFLFVGRQFCLPEVRAFATDYVAAVVWY